MNKHIFELSDGKITREAYFKKVTMSDGLKILNYAEGMTKNDNDAVTNFVDIAVKYLVLVIPNSNSEQHIKNLTELDAVFDNPFIPIKIAEEFEKYVAPYLESLNISRNKTMELQNQALNK